MAKKAINIELMKAINRATFDAFIDSGRYALSKRQAYEQFGKTAIDLLISNKLLKEGKILNGQKQRFLISDIISGIKIFQEILNNPIKRK